MLTLEQWQRHMTKFVYARRRAKKLERKKNPKLKFSALHSSLNGKLSFPAGTHLRIRLPADYSIKARD